MKNISVYIISTLLLVILAACTSERMASIERGSDVGFREGYPEVRMLAIGLFDEDEIPGVNLHLDIVKGSLIYRSSDGIFRAEVTVQVQIIQKTDSEDITIQNRQIKLEITDTDPLVVDSSELTTYTERILLGPGSYDIIVAVTDVSSGMRTLRRTTTTIPDPEGDITGITSVLLLGKSNDNDLGFQPVTTYFVPGRYDSLKFQFQITRPEAEPETRVVMELLRFLSDSLHARDLAGIQHSPGSVGYRGIDYSRPTLIESTERILRSETGSIFIEYVTPILPSANYRFAVNVTEDNVQQDELFKAREFFISNSANFPNIENIMEMAEPLIYLMDRRDHDRLMRIEDPDSLKREIDRFWLSNIRNINKTKQVIELFYSRVEQANKQFSNYKEGWKTDMGMVFILFGPPLQVESSLDTSIWFYSYMRNDPRTYFRFFQPKMADQFFPFQHYIVDRQRFYHSVEYEKRRDWLTGNILNLQ
jgi:GWxTD domain-containing protein